MLCLLICIFIFFFNSFWISSSHVNQSFMQDFCEIRHGLDRMYGSWLSNYRCNRCLSPQMLWVRTPLRWGVLDTTLCDKVFQWLATGRRFSAGSPVSSSNKTYHHNIAEILLKVVLNTIKPKPNQAYYRVQYN